MNIIMKNNISAKNLNILKAALPFMPVNMQRTISGFVKIEEFNNMFNDLNSSLDNTLNACALETQENRQNFNPSDLIFAITPYLDKNEVDMINLFMNFSKIYNLFNMTGNFDSNPAEILGKILASNSTENSYNSNNFNNMNFSNNASSYNNMNFSNNTGNTNNPDNINSSNNSGNNYGNINIENLKNLLSPEQKAMFDSYSSLINNN